MGNNGTGKTGVDALIEIIARLQEGDVNMCASYMAGLTIGLEMAANHAALAEELRRGISAEVTDSKGAAAELAENILAAQ